MARETLTLRLEGDVPLSDFAFGLRLIKCGECGGRHDRSGTHVHFVVSAISASFRALMSLQRVTWRPSCTR